MFGVTEPARTPEPPYYAVIFTSRRNVQPGDRYDETAARMLGLAAEQPGFLGVDTAHEGIGITVSYWSDLESIKAWKANVEHREAQARGKSEFYSRYKVRICTVVREYEFER